MAIWDEINEATIIAEKCDKFESARRGQKRFEPRSFERSSFRKTHGNSASHWKGAKERKGNSEKKQKEVVTENCGNRDRYFEKPKKIFCFAWRQPNQIKLNCPERQKNHIHHLSACQVFGEEFEPYIKTSIINGKGREYFIHTGSGIDICESEMISVKDSLPEQIWVKQPFDATCKCLPFTKIELNRDFGTVVTKASVKPADLIQGFHFSGNQSKKLIEEQRKIDKPGERGLYQKRGKRRTQKR